MKRRTWVAGGVLMHGLGMAAGEHAGPTALRVAFDDYPPYQQARRDGQPEGLDVQLLAAVFERARLTAVWQRMPWPRQLLSLREGVLDLALGASHTPDREAFALWTEPYRPDRAALMGEAATLSPSDAALDLRTLAQRGVRIGLIRNTNYPGELAEALQDPDFVRRLVLLRNAHHGLHLLRRHEVDYLLDDPVTLVSLARQRPGVALQRLRWVYQGDARLMLARSTEAAHPGLLASLNRAIAALRGEGVLKALLKAHTMPGTDPGEPG